MLMRRVSARVKFICSSLASDWFIPRGNVTVEWTPLAIFIAINSPWWYWEEPALVKYFATISWQIGKFGSWHLNWQQQKVEELLWSTLKVRAAIIIYNLSPQVSEGPSFRFRSIEPSLKTFYSYPLVKFGDNRLWGNGQIIYNGMSSRSSISTQNWRMASREIKEKEREKKKQKVRWLPRCWECQTSIFNVILQVDHLEFKL